MAVTSLKHRIQHEAYRLVLWQLAGVLLLAILGLLFWGQTTGLSLLSGGLAYGLPNLIFVWLVFRYTGAQQMAIFMAAFFAGEMLKLFVGAILFLVIVKYLPVSLLSTLIGLIGAIVFFWIASLICFSRT